MKKFPKLLGLALLLITASAYAQMTGLAAAKVNGTPILQSRLDASIKGSLAQSGKTTNPVSNPEEYKALQDNLLDQLVVQELLYQESQKRGITPSDAEVDILLKQAIAEFQSEDVFLIKIAEVGYDKAAYIEDIGKRLAVRDMIKRDLIDQMEVSEDEITTFYNENTDKMILPDEIHARHILIKLPPNAADDQVKAAEEKTAGLMKRARKGEDFAELAKQHSQGPSAPQGGDLGFFGRGRMVPAFEQAAFALKDGEVSEPVRTQFGYHVIKREGTRGGEKVTRDQAANQIREYVKGIKVKASIDSLIEELRGKANIEILL